MDRRARSLVVLLLVVVIAVTGGAAILFGGRGAGDGTGDLGGSANAQQSVVGVIVGVQSEGLDKVRGFTLRTNNGASIPFALGTLENGVEFPPGHLVEHQATAQPIRVWYRTEGDVRVAVRIEDAS